MSIDRNDYGFVLVAVSNEVVIVGFGASVKINVGNISKDTRRMTNAYSRIL